MRALSIHAPWVREILTGLKKEEYRTWKPKEKGRILICSSAKKYKGCVCGYALCTAEIGDIYEYPGEGVDGGMLYGWQLKKIKFVEPFPVKGKLHFFDVDDSQIKILDGITMQEFFEKYCDPLRSW